MATPLVASVAATVWSKHPTWTRAQVWDAVRLNTDNIDAQNPSFLGKLGSGRLNMQKALTP
jgi:subtilisin family serine protease